MFVGQIVNINFEFAHFARNPQINKIEKLRRISWSQHFHYKWKSQNLMFSECTIKSYLDQAQGQLIHLLNLEEGKRVLLDDLTIKVRNF